MGEFFGFDGRISRLGFLWRSIVALTSIAGLAAGSLWGLGHVYAPDGLAGPSGLSADVVTGAVLLLLWCSFALASRRLRDMGLEPVHIVPLYAALWVINAVLLQPLSRIDPRSDGAVEAGWAVLQWLVAVPLLAWPPSKRGPAPPRRFYEPNQPTAYLNWREGG